MSKNKSDLIAFRLERAAEAFDLAKIAIARKYWNSAVSELYYTCFYFTLALFAKNDIETYTHSGVKTVFSLQFVKEGKIDKRWGQFLGVLFDKRQEGDYGDFVILTEEEVLFLLQGVEEFSIVIKKMIQE